MTRKIKSPFVLDVSGWKDSILWNDVHPRPDLVICQASQGIQEWDDLFITHWNNLEELPIKRGAYHVFDPNANGQQQIENYYHLIEQAGGFDEDCIPPILDVNDLQSKSKWARLGKNIRYCLDEMQTYFGQTPIIHVSKSSWRVLRNRWGNYPDWTNEYLLWVPWYPSDPDIYERPPVNTFPFGWENWALWKYEDAATISGIKGYVSLSTISDWYAEKIGITQENSLFSNPQQQMRKIKATVIAGKGAIIRRRSMMESKMLTFLGKGSELVGESIEIVNPHEAWLQVTKPVVGWCPIVHSGKTYLSISIND